MSKHYFTIEFDSLEGNFKLMPDTNPEPTRLDEVGAETIESAVKLLNFLYKTK